MTLELARRSTSKRMQTFVARQSRTPSLTIASWVLPSSTLISTTTRTYSSRGGLRGTTAQPIAAKPGSSGLDPDKIKGPGGLTMTQIGKLVRESHTKDLDHKAKTQQQQQEQQPAKSPKH